METRHARSGTTRPRKDPLAFSDTVVSSTKGAELMARALRHEDRGDLAAARALYRKVAELEEMAALALAECARLERSLEMLDLAIVSLTEALHHCVDDAEQSCAIYVELGDVHAQRGDYEEASYFYRRAMRYDPSRSEVRSRFRTASRLSFLPGFERSA